MHIFIQTTHPHTWREKSETVCEEFNKWFNAMYIFCVEGPICHILMRRCCWWWTTTSTRGRRPLTTTIAASESRLGNTVVDPTSTALYSIDIRWPLVYWAFITPFRKTLTGARTRPWALTSTSRTAQLSHSLLVLEKSFAFQGNF